MDNYLPQSNIINADKLARVFIKAKSHKYFWFAAILNKAANSSGSVSVKEIIIDIIINSYYMVNTCKLSLGYNDTIAKAAKEIYDKFEINPNSNDIYIELTKKKVFDDEEILKLIKPVSENVPVRFLYPYTCEDMRFDKKSVEHINELYIRNVKDPANRLPYYFGDFKGEDTEIIFDESFIDYVTYNLKILQDFGKYNLIDYLQKRNPSVPGIINKLDPQNERKLKDVIKFYKLVIEIDDIGVKDIYKERPLKDIVTNNDLSIDHFIPWSYVAHDEFWNLTPTSKSINSSKSNILPNWDMYFDKLIDQKFAFHKVIWKNEKVYNSFNDIQDIYLNVDEIKNAYNNPNISKGEFKNCMYNYMKPIYEVAERSGFAAGWCA